MIKTMKKTLTVMLIVFFATFGLINNPVKANDQFIGHIIVQILKGNADGMKEVLGDNAKGAIHGTAHILLAEVVKNKNVPDVLKPVISIVRQDVIDEAYKCSLLKDSAYEVKNNIKKEVKRCVMSKGF